MRWDSFIFLTFVPFSFLRRHPVLGDCRLQCCVPAAGRPTRQCGRQKEVQPMLTGWFVTLRSPVTAGLRVTPARLVLNTETSVRPRFGNRSDSLGSGWTLLAVESLVLLTCSGRVWREGVSGYRVAVLSRGEAWLGLARPFPPPGPE